MGRDRRVPYQYNAPQTSDMREYMGQGVSSVYIEFFQSNSPLLLVTILITALI
jgi:hypothetical protein